MDYSSTSTIPLCEFCGQFHPHQTCWRVKELETHPNGTVKRVVLHEPQFVQLSGELSNAKPALGERSEPPTQQLGEAATLRKVLAEVLTAWKQEANEGDGITEEHGQLYDRALAMTKAVSS